MHDTYIYNVSMRQANKQKEFPASTFISYRHKNVNALPFDVQGTCRKPPFIKQENAHPNSERYHYSIKGFFPPASF